MRKVIVFNRLSLDGYYSGPNGEIDWFNHNPEDVNRAAHEMMQPDTVLFGRETYQLFEDYWPRVAQDPNALKSARNTATELNQMTKIVFSRTRKKVAWENAILHSDHLVDKVMKLKETNGADITIFGSGSIIGQLAYEELIDEYILAVIPIILGAGKSFFKEMHISPLRLLESRTFSSGTVLLHYTTHNKACL